MKANELSSKDLMIEDWLQDSFGNIGQVYRLDPGRVHLRLLQERPQDEEYIVHDIQPIPITKELLLRSGFELKSESPYSQYFAIDFDDIDIDYLVVELHPKANYVRVNYQTEKRKVHLSCSLGGCHLHELQHMLRMCSIKIDWKV